VYIYTIGLNSLDTYSDSTPTQSLIPTEWIRKSGPQREQNQLKKAKLSSVDWKGPNLDWESQPKIETMWTEKVNGSLVIYKQARWCQYLAVCLGACRQGLLNVCNQKLIIFNFSLSLAIPAFGV